MEPSKARPLVLVSGFLGTGKTTLLRFLLKGIAEQGFLADVILNDFADARIDSAKIGELADTVHPVTSGCACCESLDELRSICRLAGKGDADVLILELNGSTDPGPLLESVALLDSRLSFEPLLSICVVNVRNWGRRSRWNKLERLQVSSAGAWVPSHAEQEEQRRIEAVAAEIGDVAPSAHRLSRGQLLESLLAVLRGSPLERDHEAPQKEATRLQPDPHRSHSHHGEHEISHQFTSHRFPLPSRVPLRSMEALFEGLPDPILRAKALVKLVEHPGPRWLFQRCGNEPPSAPQRVDQVQGIPSSLVCIGTEVDPASVRDLLRFHFGEEAIRAFEELIPCSRLRRDSSSSPGSNLRAESNPHLE